MKVVCGACQAKYQIPDERVAGRKLKIRCRKCGDAIVVRGDQLAAPDPTEEPTKTNGHHDTAPGAEWHLSIDGDQHGPYPTDQMASMLREGQVAWETFAWREGYADWKTAAESDTLVRAVASIPQLEMAAPTPEPVAAPVVHEDDPTRMVGSVPPGSLAPVARTTFSQRAHRVQSAPPGQLAPAASSVSIAASYQHEAHSNGYGASPYVSASQAMTGERHEDSVLFSTKNLQATVSPSQASPARGNGFAGGDGSGLIDIRALAALARGGQHTAPALPVAVASAIETSPVERHGRDEVMALASQTGAFSNLDSLRPFETAPRQSSNAVPIAIVAGSALIAVAAVFAVYLTRQPAAAPPAAAAAITEEPAGLAAAPELPAAAPEAPAPAAPEPEKAEEPVAAAAAADEEEPAAPSEKSEKRSKGATSSKRVSHSKSEGRSSKGEAVAAIEKSKPEPEPKAEKEAKAEKEGKADKEAKGDDGASIDDLLLADAKPEKAEKPAPTIDEVTSGPAKPASSKSRSIDELLDTAVIEGGKKPAKAAEPSAASAALPDTPSRDQVQSAMKAITPDVKACAAGQAVESPTATVAITISGSNGKVSSVRVTGIQGAVGSCIAKAVRGASFPKFAKESLTLNYPFRLQ